MTEEEDYLEIERENPYININYFNLRGFLEKIKNIELIVKTFEQQMNENIKENKIKFIECKKFIDGIKSELKEENKNSMESLNYGLINSEQKNKNSMELINSELINLDRNINNKFLELNKNQDEKFFNLEKLIDEKFKNHLIKEHKSILNKLLGH